MKCPACGCRNVHCKDSRYREAQDCRWRRYLCESCGTRFTTIERVAAQHIKKPKN